MKSLTAVCQTGASMPAINPNGRIARHPHHRGDGENAEMKMYLSKLKDLVPFMPKNRKLSKLEIIQHVIDYICDLQTELETHPEIGNFDANNALNLNESSSDDVVNDNDDDDDEVLDRDISARLSGDFDSDTQLRLQQQQQTQQHSSPVTTRQPLVDRQVPNTILPATAASSSHNLLPAAVAVVAAVVSPPTAQSATTTQTPQQPHHDVAMAHSTQMKTFPTTTTTTPTQQPQQLVIS